LTTTIPLLAQQNNRKLLSSADAAASTIRLSKNTRPRITSGHRIIYHNPPPHASP